MLRKLITSASVFALTSMSLMAVTGAPAYAASVYYVDSAAGSDSTGSGNSASPWKTIGKAASVAGAGDTVKIRSGTYRETVRPANSGTSAAPITFEPDSGADVTVSGADLLTSSWSAQGNDIFRATANLPMGHFLDQVYVDGVANNLARSPNTPVGNSYDPALWNRNPSASNQNLLNDPVNLDQPAGTWDGAAVFAEDSGSWNFSSVLVDHSTPGNLNLKRDQKSYQLKLSGYNNTLQLVGPGGVLGTYGLTVAPNTTYNLKVVTAGSSIQVFVNNGATPVIAVTNSDLAEGSFGLGLESNSGSAAAKGEFTNVNATITSQDTNQASGRHTATFASNIRGWSMPVDTGWWETDGSVLKGTTQPQVGATTARYETPTTAKNFSYSADVKLTSAGIATMTFRKEMQPGWIVDLANWGYGGGEDGTEYFVMGRLAALDYPGEWYFDKAAGQLSLRTTGSDNPAGHTIEYKARNLAFDLYSRSNVVVKGVKLFAASIDTTDGSNDVIDGINAKYVTDYYLQNGWTSGICLCGTNGTLKNSEIAYSSGSLVTLQKDDNKLVNNSIHDATYGGFVFNSAIELLGKGHLVSNNNVYHSGRSLIGGEFFANIIQYNDFHHGNYFAHDTGMLYTAHNDLGNSEIHHNYWHDNVHRSNGEGDWTGGIYLDESSANALIYDNVTWNLTWEGIVANHLSNFVQIYNNTTYNNSGIRVSEPTYGIDAYGDRIQNNIATNELGTGATAIGAVFGNNFPLGGDPQYVDALRNDLHLQSASAARNAATPIRGITEGFEGSAPDIGAYEVGGADWTAGQNLENPPIVSYQPVDTDYENLAVNGSLDLNRMQHPQLNSLYGWTRTGSGTAQPVLDVNGGTLSSRFKSETGVALGTGADGIEQTITGLSPNTTYEVRGYLRAEAAGQTVRLGVKNYGGTDTGLDESGTAWGEKTFTFTTGAAATSATVYASKSTTGGYAFVDDIMVHATAPTPKPMLRVSDVSVAEGDSGTTSASFKVTLSPASTGTVTVPYSTADGTATAPDDYAATSGTLTFAPGEVSTLVTVPVVGDTLVEPEQSFVLKLSTPAGATIADGIGVGTIVADDASIGTVSINDHTAGTGLNQFDFRGNWPTNTNSTAYQNDVTFADRTDDYYLVRFIGTQVKLITEKDTVMGIAAVSVDSGPETMVDLYASAHAGQQLVYTSPLLGSGQHVLKVRITGTKNAGASWTWTTADRVDVINAPVTTTSVNDHTVGTGLNQFEFAGNWATNTNATAYQSDVTFSDRADDYYQVRFAGTQVNVYSERDTTMGIAAISVDGGAETLIDNYATTHAGNVLVYSSPPLTPGQHIVKVRVTGTKNAGASWTWHVADRVEVFS